MQHRAINFASAAFFVTSLALANDTWVLDSSRSNARLFQGARANSELMDSGVARVTGGVKLAQTTWTPRSSILLSIPLMRAGSMYSILGVPC